MIGAILTYRLKSNHLTFHIPTAYGTPKAAPCPLARCEDRLPTQLLTPFQAEREQATRDIYNYVTVQARDRGSVE